MTRAYLRIAYVTSEFPPHPGGIATYTAEAAKQLASLGHHVEIFALSDALSLNRWGPGILLHLLVNNPSLESPARTIERAFSLCHQERRFDVVEAPEYLALAAEIVRRHPEVPVLIKLHTPTFLIEQMNTVNPRRIDKLRFLIGSLIKAERNKPFWYTYSSRFDPEAQLTRAADLVVAPSMAIYHKLQRRWGLKNRRLVHIPLPFSPAYSITSLPIETAGARITYFGRLEKRKGVEYLAAALPKVFSRYPQATVRFVGRNVPLYYSNLTMKDHICYLLRDWSNRVTFLESVPRDQLHLILAESDICVFPSIWESFGYVCLEAMAAGQAVIVSSGGGMREMVEHNKTGLIIPPRNPRAISASLSRLLSCGEFQVSLRRAARNAVLTSFCNSNYTHKLESTYYRAIEQHRYRHPGSASGLL